MLVSSSRPFPQFTRLALLLASLLCGAILALCSTQPARAAGVVTNCTIVGPGPGTLLDAAAGGGLVMFACDGTIMVTVQIPINADTIIDGTGRRVILQGDGDNRIFSVGALNGSDLIRFELRYLTLTGGNAMSDPGNSGGGAISSAGNITISHSALLSNTAEYGGAIDHRKGTLTVVDSTFAHNVAAGMGINGGGGAIDQFSSNNLLVHLIHTTIVDNHAPGVEGRDGLWIERGDLLVENSIVAANGTGDHSANCTIVPTDELNDIRTNFSAAGTNLADDATCPGFTVLDPQLGPLAAYGGSTPVYALLPGSPAIDAVGSLACSAGTDQRGELRPRDGNHDATAACDVGAFEYADRFYVSAAVDDGLIGYWKFDEGNGTVASDSSHNGFAGTLQGNALFMTSHPSLSFGNPYALQFLGGMGAVEVANMAKLNPANELTLAAWVQMADVISPQDIIAKLASANGPGFALGVSQGHLQADIWNSANTRYTVTAGSVISGAWIHLAMTWRSGDAMTAYVNGVPVGSVSVPPVPIGATDAPLRISGNGQVDDVRIYKWALAAGQIATLAAGRHCVATGTQWLDSVPDLQCPLAGSTAGNEVWVVAGRYTPTRGPDRSAAFYVPDGVSIYGGFSGTEISREQRDPAARPTILSGDSDGNDSVTALGIVTSTAGVVGANAYHVVVISSTLSATTLDGFIITAGVADGQPGAGYSSACGGGIYATGGSPQLLRLELIGNRAFANGGGIFSNLSSPRLLNVALRGNQAAAGGALYSAMGNFVLVNSLVAGNQAAGDGGGIHMRSGSPRLVNVTIGGNRSDGRGGGIYILSSSPALNNTIVGGNGAALGAQLFVDADSAPDLRRTLIQDGCPATAVCIETIDADPLYAAPVDLASVPSPAGDFHLHPPSLAIDAGDNQASISALGLVNGSVADLPGDLAGRTRILSARLVTPVIDMGAYEASNTPPVFMSVPITFAATTLPYSYPVVAVDPNDPAAVQLPVAALTLPGWLTLQGTPPLNPILLFGTPLKTDLGNHAVVLQATDIFGAKTSQSFMVVVQPRAYPLYLPDLKR